MNCIICDKNLIGKQVKFCSKTCKSLMYNYFSQRARGYKRKLELVKMKGGSCQNCGYKKCYRALSFHHRDPTKKVKKLDVRNLANSSWVSLLEEVDKCDLLCLNCHAEEHDKEFPDMEQVVSNCKLDASKKPRKCELCNKEYSYSHLKQKYCSRQCANLVKRMLIKKPSLNEILEEKKHSTWEKIAKKYGVTSKTMRKWRNYGPAP